MPINKPENKAERHCIDCGIKIIECMGFVIFLDFLEALEGKRKWNDVRERCGKCVLLWEQKNLKKEIVVY